MNNNNDTSSSPPPPAATDPFAHLSSEALTALRSRGQGQHGCRHYRRRVRFITPCCNEEWWCRHCHNEVKYQQEQDWSKKHELDRKQIREVVCALCEVRQPVSSACTACGVSFGAYSCTQCPFYEDDLSKQTYHCNDCGICRVGGRHNYFHCATCSSCYATNLVNNHVCVERAMHQNCPVCFEFLFESVDPTTVLRCGHTIHSQCLRDLERNTAAICPCCPICKKSLGDYSRYWQDIDREVAAAAAVPSEYSGWAVNILCNDCSASSTIGYSLVAHKCSACGSYNTRRMGIVTGGGAVLDDDDGDGDGGDDDDDDDNALVRVAPVGGVGGVVAGPVPVGGAAAMGVAAAEANAVLLEAMQMHELHALLEADDDDEEDDEEGGGGAGFPQFPQFPQFFPDNFEHESAEEEEEGSEGGGDEGGEDDDEWEDAEED